jgi:hypothetical protein
MKRHPTAADLLLPMHLKELDVFVMKEVRVCEARQWKLDFAEKVTPSHRLRLAFEIEGFGPRSRGGIGRHQNPKNFEEDCHKYAEAKIQGFEIFRFTTKMVENGTAKEYVRRWLDKHQ